MYIPVYMLIMKMNIDMLFKLENIIKLFVFI